MTLPRSIAIFLFLCLLQRYCSAQEKSKAPLGKIVPADFVLPSNPIIDSNSNAVILADIGSVHFVGNKYDWFSYVYKRQTRIMIVNNKAMQLAAVTVLLQTAGELTEKMDNLTATTYNLDNGRIVETKLDKDAVYEDRVDMNYKEKKFALPAVKAGSIIEYSYTVTSDFDFALPSWTFQSVGYPTLWSEYNVDVPRTITYEFMRHGIHNFCIDKSSTGHENFQVTEKRDPNTAGIQESNLMLSATTMIHQWAMKDIPAFHVENYISSPLNYIDRIESQESGAYNTQENFKIMNTWAAATADLSKREYFGGALLDNDAWLGPVVAGITEGKTDLLGNARAIYYYMTHHFTCTDHYGPWVKTTLRDVFKRNSGTVGEINLLLIAMLRQKNIQADPILLSPSELGFNSRTYPMLERLRYVVARVRIGDKTCFLDATRPQLGFGQLPGYCYNGHARVISEKEPEAVFLWADSLKESKMTMIMASIDTNGKVEGSYQSTLGEQESYNTRTAISKTGEKVFLKNIQTSYGEDCDISNAGVDSLDKPEYPVTIHYDFSLKDTLDASIIYFNPFLGNELQRNPLKEEGRQYPVEMPYVMDDTYVLNLDIPEGYEVNEMPASIKMAFNEVQSSFEYVIGKMGNMIQLRCRIKTNRAYFPPEDYNALRSLFAMIAKKESEPIVLKRK